MLCELEENESTLLVHVSENFTYYNCYVQQDGVCGWIVFSRTAARWLVLLWV